MNNNKKIFAVASLFLAALSFTACDDNTDTLGYSLTEDSNRLNVATDTFGVATRSVQADSVLSRNTVGYLGIVRDPETNAYITGDFMTQFYTLSNYKFPAEADIINKGTDGLAIADSCEIRLYFNNFFGDSLNTMKLTAYELDKPMKEDQNYYSNFDPAANGFLREGGLKVDKVYTLADQTISDSLKGTDTYNPYIRIVLNGPYTDKDNKTYNNFGTFLMRKYYEDSTYFKNTAQFINRLVPGFYFKMKSGIGSMAYVDVSQLNVFFHYQENDSTFAGVATFAGTEEVLQTTHIANDKGSIAKLALEDTCTYLKSPAGIFTEITLPVDDIFRGHDNDSINSAKIVFTRLNNEQESDYTLDIPQTLLMIPADSVYTFFEKGKIADSRTSYISTYSSTKNTYTFSDISSLLIYMKKNKEQATKENKPLGDKWNKALLVPATPTYSTSGTSKVLSKVAHDMSLTSTRLVGGQNNAHAPVKISVIYSKFGE